MKKLKKFFGVFAVTLLLMSMTSVSKSENEEQLTPDSWCQATSQQVVRDYAESHPNATYDDLWNVHIAYYSACRVAEAITQSGNW